ncbi:MAG: hypothetical protein ABF665_04455 [Gluconacetobacter sp.]
MTKSLRNSAFIFGFPWSATYGGTFLLSGEGDEFRLDLRRYLDPDGIAGRRRVRDRQKHDSGARGTLSLAATRQAGQSLP